MRIALPGCLFAVYFAICDLKQSLLMLKMSFCTLCKFCLFKGGIKDLKIYADLALLSVEGDEQVGRVTRLHSAAIGYSTVIFGNIYGEIEMIDTWREVWQNLEKDNFLPQKLVIFKASYTQKILTKKYSLWMPILINLQWFILLYK